MNYIDHGHLKGKTVVDSGSTLTGSQRLTIIRQQRTLRRMDDPLFREAVRLAARADMSINGGETAIEQLHREEVQLSTTAKGAISMINRAAAVTGERSGIITL